jgi:hypothetical protein
MIKPEVGLTLRQPKLSKSANCNLQSGLTQTYVFSIKAKALSADCLKNRYPTQNKFVTYGVNPMDQMWNTTVD